MGVKCKDGIVLGTEKIVVNKMLLPGTDKRIFSIDLQTGCVSDSLIDLYLKMANNYVYRS